MEKGYEKIEVFKLSRELALKIHAMTLTLPKFEMYEEGSQIRRSSKSVPANILEGYCLRRHKNEYLQYLHRALASSDETLLHLGILYDTGSLKDQITYVEFRTKYDRLGKMLFRFIQKVHQNHMTPLYLHDTKK